MQVIRNFVNADENYSHLAGQTTAIHEPMPALRHWARSSDLAFAHGALRGNADTRKSTVSYGVFDVVAVPMVGQKVVLVDVVGCYVPSGCQSQRLSMLRRPEGRLDEAVPFKQNEQKTSAKRCESTHAALGHPRPNVSQNNLDAIAAQPVYLHELFRGPS